MSAFIGIDLGTTYSAIAFIDDTGRPIIIRDERGENLTPSVVAMEGGETLVGEPARQMWAEDHTQGLARFKRDMGTDTSYAFLGRSITPAELSQIILQRMSDIGRSQLGKLGEAVVTIPANFSSEARAETLEAARRAGLEIRNIIDEPTAAALYYAYAKRTELNGAYAVFDFGGGTFDVSIIRIDGENIEVVASSGVSRLGGDDLDRALQKLVAEKFEATHGEPLPEHAYSLDAAEVDKKKLTDRPKIKAGPPLKPVELTREEFEAAIAPLVSQAEMACEAVLDEAGLTPGDIKGVFLAGGSTRVPAIRRSVTEAFGQEPISTANVDEVVAMGAALFAAFKGDRSQLNATQKAAISAISKVEEITNEYFGTISVGMNASKGSEELQNTILIHKGEKIPVEVTESFFTVGDGQTSVRCCVTMSKSPETDPRFVKKVWEGDLELPAGRPAGQQIDVTFGFDENQNMTARFKDVATGKTTSIDLHELDKKFGSGGIEKFKVS